MHHAIQRYHILNRHHLGAGDHHLAHGGAAKSEHVVQHLALLRVQRAAFLALLHQHTQLAHAVHTLVTGVQLHANQPQHKPRRCAQKHGKWANNLCQNVHERHNRHRHALGFAQGQRAGHKLGKHNLKERRDQQTDHRAQNDVRLARQVCFSQQLFKQRGNARLAHRANGD